MKFSTILLSTFASAACAFSPVSNPNIAASRVSSHLMATIEEETVVAATNVDKTLSDVDEDAAHDVFDPLSGSEPALIRNNKDEVWVPQVCAL